MFTNLFRRLLGNRRIRRPAPQRLVERVDAKVKLKRTLFGRWIILNGEVEGLGWSGSSWVHVHADTGLGVEAQVSNLDTLNDAKEYAARFQFTVVEVIK